jgi:hypothetical protein
MCCEETLLDCLEQDRQPEARGQHMALAAVVCGPSRDLGVSQCKKGRNFLLLRNIDVSIGHMHCLNIRAKDRKKYNILMKQFCICSPITLKSRYCAKGSLFLCSDHMAFNKTI